MERADGNGGLVDDILRASRRVVLLRGPAGCGKTSAIIEMYRSYLDDAGRPGCLLVVPNAVTARRLRGKLLDESPAGVILSPQVCTFSALAGRILSAGGDNGHTVSPFRRRLLLRRIVAELCDAGELVALRDVADTPGLIVALDRAIAELKRAAVEPDRLARAIDDADGRNRDLLAVYRRYQRHLLDAGAYDVEGQMWKALEVLTNDAADPFAAPGEERIAALAVDGFTDFTPTQLGILVRLSRRLERTVITLTCPAPGDERDRLWHWTKRTLDNVRGAFGGELAEIETPGCNGDEPGLRALHEKVFDIDAVAQRSSRQSGEELTGETPVLPRSMAVPAMSFTGETPVLPPVPPPVPPPALRGLRIIAAAGLDAEVSAVARRVKRLLVEGARAGSIAVLARSMDAYRPAVERIFAAHEIPVAPASAAITDVPVIRFLLDAAAVGPEFAFADVLGVIGNSYFHPESLGDFDDSTVATAEMLIREGNVLAGRDAYARACERLVGRVESAAEQADEDEEGQPAALGAVAASADNIRDAGRMLDGLFELCETARTAGARAGLTSLAESLDLCRRVCLREDDRLVARDLRALSALTDALGSLDDETAKLPPAALREALASLTVPPARGESLIEVMDVLDARAVRFEHVFLLGLSEGRFPRRFTEGSLVGENDRRRWSERGVMLDSRSDLTAREMLLFYLAVSRADRSLTISFLESDSSGKPGAPSSFLLSLLEPFGGLEAVEKASLLTTIPAGRFIPPAAELSTRPDAVSAAIAGLFDDRFDPRGDALAWAARNAPAQLVRSATGLWSRSRRWRRAECDEFDGRITDAPLLDTLAGRYPGGVVFSATQLNAFAQCPWRFLATWVLKLQPIVSPQRQMEAVSRGVFCHNVLFRLMSRLRDEIGGPIVLAKMDESRLSQALDDAIAAEAEAVEARRPAYPALWKIQRERARRELWEYLKAQRSAKGIDVESLHFELGFGLERRAGELSDPAGVSEAVPIDTPAGPVQLRGRIDRVDRVRLEGVEGLLAVDYKTGRMPAVKEIDSGLNLQLALYVEAAETILGTDALAGAFHSISDGSVRLFGGIATSRKKGRPFVLTGDLDEKRQAAKETIGRYVSSMAAGRFDALPVGKCPSWCPFRQICCYSPARSDLKQTGLGNR